MTQDKLFPVFPFSSLFRFSERRQKRRHGYELFTLASFSTRLSSTPSSLSPWREQKYIKSQDALQGKTDINLQILIRQSWWALLNLATSGIELPAVYPKGAINPHACTSFRAILIR